MRALDRKLLRDLARLRGQVLTIALVVGAGIAAFVSMRGNHATLVEAKDQYYAASRFADVFARLERAPEALRAELERIPGVARVETRVKSWATLPLERQTRPVGADVISLPPDGSQPALNALHLVEGRLPDPRRAEEVVLLHAFGTAHGFQLGDELPVIIEGRKKDVRVVGLALSPEYVMALSPGTMTQDPKAFGVVWMNRAPLSAALRMEGGFNDVVLALRPGASVDGVLDALDKILKPNGGLGALPRRRQLSHFVLEGELVQLEAMSHVVPAIFLAVAALLLNVVLSRLVYLQRPEIATLKAIGYSDREVGLHFFELVLVIVAVGGLVGVGLGAWLGRGLTELYADYFKFPELSFRLHLQPAATALLISLLSALAGAFLSVRRVAALPPAEAMRPPAPARYRRSPFDALGLAEIAGPALHMIVRELFRRPLRTLGSTLAIAASVGLLVVAGWYRDGLEILVRTQFHEVMREDVLVTFTGPIHPNGLGSLRQLPGVLEAEGLRVVPVRFKNGHRHREGSVFLYPDDIDMRGVRDKWGEPRALPIEGMLLTEALGRALRARPGEAIEVEIREGERPTLPMVVAGLVDEGFGLQGHIRAPVLEARLHQPPLMSAGLLRADPAHIEALERALKELPQVASVTRRAAVLAQFEAQSGQMIQVMTWVITLFGATITVGVVYNDARIALSLRARDLASLRVLGYRKSEVSTILLGEMAVELLAALPLGFLFGNLLVEGIAATLDPETYRLPIVVSQASYAYAAVVALGASAMSALLVRRKLDRLDLIGVLKTRE